MNIRLLFLSLLLGSCTVLNAQSLDLKILDQINGPENRKSDNTWKAISESSGYVVAAAPLAMLVTGIIKSDGNLKTKAYETGISLFCTEGSVFILKRIIKRNRPFTDHPDLITSKINETDYSFPSGHASLAFSMATSLSLSFPKWYVVAPSFIYAGTVSYSRLYLGVHYPSDVLGGAAVGILSSYITFKAQKWLNASRYHHKKAD